MNHLPPFPNREEARWIYRMRSNGTVQRDLTVRTVKGGEPILLAVMTDLHINYCNEKDLADPVLRSTAEHRVAFDRHRVLPNVENSFHYADRCERTVLMGDVYDYVSDGVIELADRYVFSHKNVIACLGNHEPYRQMQGTVPETLPFAERRALVAAHWCNNPDYYSEVVGDRVMLILLDNGFGFLEMQIERLRADLERARREQLSVLLFFHVPLNTGKPEDAASKALWCNSVTHWNFYNSAEYVGPQSTGVNQEIYRIITSNADVIRACFAGHVHSDFYLELPATTPDGTSAAIPQYLLTGAAYDRGHFLQLSIY